MAITPDKPATPPKAPEKPNRVIPTVSDFEIWVAGRTGLTLREFFDIWVSFYDLTAKEIEALWTQVKKGPPGKPPPELPAPGRPPPPIQPRVKPDLTIERTPYPKWWKDSLNAKIEFQAPGSQVLATISGNLRLYVSTIVITVTDEVWINVKFGDSGESGTIYLGGPEQPKGIVIAMGNSPAPCGRGPLTITASDPSALTPWVGGFATCFAMPEKE